jgi:hypothetical protein
MKCGKKVVTIDRDEGVTPFMIQCPSCGTHGAQSCFYRVRCSASDSITPSHEWYMPDEGEIAEMLCEPELVSTVTDHIRRGGLLLREIGGPRYVDTWRKKHQRVTGEKQGLSISRMSNKEGPRLLVEGCKHCQSYTITLWEKANFEGSCMVFSERGSYGDLLSAISDAAFWGRRIKMIVEIDDDLVSEAQEQGVEVTGG